MFFLGQRGDDTFDGGPGMDTINLSTSSDPGNRNIHHTKFLTGDLTIDLSSGSFTHSVYGNKKLVSIGNVQGGRGNNRIVGTDKDNVLIGWQGTNTLIGGGGDDTLEAAPAGGSAGTVDGGEGNDTLIVFGGTYQLPSWSGPWILTGTNTKDTFILGTTLAADMRNLENLSTVSRSYGPRTSNVEFTGDGKANILTGGSGDDVLNGAGGNDTFVIVKEDGNTVGVDVVTDFTLADDKIQFRGFAAGSAAAVGTTAGTGNKIYVGTTAVVEIRAGNSRVPADNTKAGNIISQMKYEFAD